jgi:hypothetical protein
MENVIINMILTKKSVLRHLIKPLANFFDIKLVGSINKKGYSKKDIDILLHLPKYPKSEKVFNNFMEKLGSLKWQYLASGEYQGKEIVHNFEHRSISKFPIGLDVFIKEKIK